MFVFQIDIAVSDETLWEERLALADAVTQVFTRIDPQTITIEATFSDDIAAEILSAAFGGAVKPLVVAGLQDGWESLPAMIGSKFLLVDSGKAIPETNRLVLQVDADGTDVFAGHQHPSTIACLRWMFDLCEEERLADGFRCLDVGCGNGLLGVAAALLGAGEVEGFDLCEEAVVAARENAARYELAQSSWSCADLTDFHAEPGYDLVVANLFSELLEGSFECLQSWLAPSGYLLISGILQRFKDPVLDSAQAAGLSIVESRQRGPWVTALLK